MKATSLIAAQISPLVLPALTQGADPLERCSNGSGSNTTGKIEHLTRPLRLVWFCFFGKIERAFNKPLSRLLLLQFHAKAIVRLTDKAEMEGYTNRVEKTSMTPTVTCTCTWICTTHAHENRNTCTCTHTGGKDTWSPNVTLFKPCIFRF